MKTLIKFPILMVALLMATLALARGEMAMGNYNMDFTQSGPLWDISGSYSESLDGLDMDYTLSMDSAGKITGYGVAYYDDYGDYLDADFTITGSLKASAGLVRVRLSIKMAGSGNISGYAATFRASVKELLELNSPDRTLTGSVSGKVSVSVPGYGKESARVSDEVYLELPEDMDGSWALDFDVQPRGTKYLGGGSITLGSGATYSFSLTGSYSAKTDLSKLSLRGLPANAGVKLKLVGSAGGGQLNLLSLKGKALGQKLNLVGGP